MTKKISYAINYSVARRLQPHIDINNIFCQHQLLSPILAGSGVDIPLYPLGSAPVLLLITKIECCDAQLHAAVGEGCLEWPSVDSRLTTYRAGEGCLEWPSACLEWPSVDSRLTTYRVGDGCLEWPSACLEWP